MSKVKVLYEDCDPSKAEDKSLPNTAYIVTYYENGQKKYDIAVCSKKVDLFDHYWDKYSKDFLRFDQTEGRANPKLWSPPK